MKKHIVLLMALALPGAALAHDPLIQPNPRVDNRSWMGGLDGASYGQGRIRTVHHGGDDRAAALTVDQVYLYERVYARRLTDLSRHMSVHRAMPRARHDAYHAIAGIPGDAPARTTRIAPLTAGHIFGD